MCNSPVRVEEHVRNARDEIERLAATLEHIADPSYALSELQKRSLWVVLAGLARILSALEDAFPQAFKRDETAKAAPLGSDGRRAAR